VLALCAALLDAAKHHSVAHGTRSLDDPTVLTGLFRTAFGTLDPPSSSGVGGVDFGPPARRDMYGPPAAVALAKRIVELSRQIESRAMLGRLARLAAGGDPEQVLGTDAPALLAGDPAPPRTPSDGQDAHASPPSPEPAPAGSGPLAPSMHVPGVQAAAGDMPPPPTAALDPEIAHAAVADDDAAIDCAPVAQLSEAVRREALERAFLRVPPEMPVPPDIRSPAIPALEALPAHRRSQAVQAGAGLPLPAITAGGEALLDGCGDIAVAPGSEHPGKPADRDSAAAALAVRHVTDELAVGPAHGDHLIATRTPEHRSLVRSAPESPASAHFAPDYPGGDDQAPFRTPSSRIPEPRDSPPDTVTPPAASPAIPLQDVPQGPEGWALPTWAVAAFPGDAPTTAAPQGFQPPPVSATEYRDVCGPATPGHGGPPRSAVAAGTAPSSGTGRGTLPRRYGGRWTWAAATALSTAAVIALYVASATGDPDLPGAVVPTSGNPAAAVVPPLLPPALPSSTALATTSTAIPDPVPPQPASPAPAPSSPAPAPPPALQVEVDELRAAGAELRGLLEDAERRAEEAIERASAQERRAEDLARETATMRRDAERSNTRLVEARAQAEALKADLATARARIEGLEREVRAAVAAARRNTVAGTAAGSTGAAVAASASAPVQASRAAARSPQGVVPAGERGTSPVLTEAAARDAWTGAQPCLAVYLREGETPLRLARRIGLHELVLFVLNRNFLTLQPYNPATGLGDRELLGIDQPLQHPGGTWLYVPPTIPSLESYQIRTLSAEELAGIRKVGFACSAEQITARLAEAEQTGSIARGTLRRPQ